MSGTQRSANDGRRDGGGSTERRGEDGVFFRTARRRGESGRRLPDSSSPLPAWPMGLDRLLDHVRRGRPAGRLGPAGACRMARPRHGATQGHVCDRLRSRSTAVAGDRRTRVCASEGSVMESRGAAASRGRAGAGGSRLCGGACFRRDAIGSGDRRVLSGGGQRMAPRSTRSAWRGPRLEARLERLPFGRRPTPRQCRAAWPVESAGGHPCRLAGRRGPHSAFVRGVFAQGKHVSRVRTGGGLRGTSAQATVRLAGNRRSARRPAASPDGGCRCHRCRLGIRGNRTALSAGGRCGRRDVGCQHAPRGIGDSGCATRVFRPAPHRSCDVRGLPPHAGT